MSFRLPTQVSARPSKGFTLIEVLVVVAIIALLIAILMPSLASARAAARNTMCLSNLHQFNLATQSYASSWKGVIPRGSSPNTPTTPYTPHWTVLVARMMGDRTQYKDDNELPVEKRPMYQCPEHSQHVRRMFVDYVSNALDPAGRKPSPEDGKVQWNEVKYINVSAYFTPSSTVCFADAEYAEKNVSVLDDASFTSAIASYYDHVANKPRIDVMEVWKGAHLPEGNKTFNLSDEPGPRRVARHLHLKQVTNAAMMDGSGYGIPLAPKSIVDNVDKYAYWLRKFGVRDAEKWKTEPMDYPTVGSP